MAPLPDSLKVGVETIDSRHEEFWERFERLKGVSDTEFVGRFEELIEHTLSHFAEEESEMEDIDYPNRSEHKGEHRKALEEMDYFFQKAKGGRMVFARGYVKDRLGDWFRNHLLNMDSDLARVMRIGK